MRFKVAHVLEDPQANSFKIGDEEFRGIFEGPTEAFRANWLNRLQDREVPHDLILSILEKLPVKSLVRFKHVSKLWFRLIIDPGFIDRHLSNRRNKDPGFVKASTGFVDSEIRYRKYIFMDSMVVNRDNAIFHSYTWLVDVPPDDRYDMMNSCDGILCFQGNINICVYNPATKEYRFLPSGPWCRSDQRLGFGRDLVTKRHKIVMFSDPFQSKTGQDHLHHDVCLVFNLDPNPNSCWRTVGAVPYKINAYSRSAYSSGAIYWFTHENLHPNKSEVIIMFDLHTEKFQPIPHPNHCSNKKRSTLQLGTLRECLCLAYLGPNHQLTIWIMQQQITWDEVYCIQLWRNELQDDLFRRDPRYAFAENKDGTLLICAGDGFYYYKQNNEIRCVSHILRQCGVPTAFTESLVPIYGGV
ncbi:hypothetical protein V6N13_035531 [Hibiscus sabdariffa]